MMEDVEEEKDFDLGGTYPINDEESKVRMDSKENTFIRNVFQNSGNMIRRSEQSISGGRDVEELEDLPAQEVSILDQSNSFIEP